MQLVYFRGFGECRASRWVADPRALTDLMTKISCRGGQTQIGRVLRHVRTEASQAPLKVLVYVGDAMEEPIGDLCAVAGELGLLGVKAFMFHEGRDVAAGRAFREIARLTGGVYLPFNAASAAELKALLEALARRFFSFGSTFTAGVGLFLLLAAFLMLSWRIAKKSTAPSTGR